MKLSDSRRRIARNTAILATAVAAIGFGAAVVDALPAGTPPASAVNLTPASGDSSTIFRMAFPSFQTCPGDNNAGYTWGTFITPVAQDPATLTFTGSGSPVGAPFTAALRDQNGSAIRAQAPGLGDGSVNPPQMVTFGGAAFAAVPAGDYWLGIACVKTDANSVPQNMKYWSTKITIATSSGAGPNNFTYAPAGTGSTTTTTTTTSTPTTTVAGSTTTTSTVAGTTTTTAKPGGSTTTTTAKPGGSTTTTTTTIVGSGSATTTTLYSSGGPTGGGSGSLPSTGSSPTALIVWGVLLLVFGRMAILFGRKPKVV
jgi:LPXTG-motif cell wall-anchored protein